MKAIKTYAVFLIFLAILAITPVLAQPYNLASVNWVKYIKLSGGRDYACGTCIFGDYLAVVGYANWHPSLILLDRSTGYIIRKWVGEDYGIFCNCFSTGNTLYAVSTKGAIYAFDKDLNLLSKARGPSNSRFSSITYDSEYLYIGGYIWKDINLDGKDEEICYIEKRTKNLELISYKELYTRNWKDGYIYDLGINPTTGELWAVGGYEDTSNRTHSLIVIFDKELRELKRIDYPYGNEYYLDWLFGICFDDIGNAYIGGCDGVAKFDKYGNVINIIKVNKYAVKITCINGLVYTFDFEYIDNYWRHVLYILDSELNMIEKHVLSENVNADSLFLKGRPCFDGKNVYVAGFDYALGNYSRWAVYSLAVPTKHLYLVCIDNSCSYFEKGSIIPAKQDIPTLGGLIIKRFEGYIDNYGNNLGKSVVVNGPLKLSSVYREELNLPLLSVIIVIVLVPLFVIINKIKIGKGSGTIVKEAKSEEKAGTEVREPTELEKELSILNERLSRLEELYKKGEIEEYAYKKLKEEYESKKKEIEKKMKSH